MKIEKRLIILSIFFVALGGIALIVTIILFSKGESLNFDFPVDSDKLSDFGSFIAGTVGVLWSLVGVFLFWSTFLLQSNELRLQRQQLELQREELEMTRGELRRSADASTDLAKDSKANAIVNLYQTTTNQYFFELQQSAWKKLIHCLNNKEYSDFLISTFFVTEYRKKELSPIIESVILEVYKNEISKNPTNEEVKRIIKLDDFERHKLDDIISFFSLITLRDAPEEIFEKTDFFYDWWRPLLWWIADERTAQYLKDPLKRKYAIKPQMISMLTILDSYYKFDTSKSAQDRWEQFLNHPIVLKNGIDERHDYPYREINDELMNTINLLH